MHNTTLLTFILIIGQFCSLQSNVTLNFNAESENGCRNNYGPLGIPCRPRAPFWWWSARLTTTKNTASISTARITTKKPKTTIKPVTRKPHTTTKTPYTTLTTVTQRMTRTTHKMKPTTPKTPTRRFSLDITGASLKPVSQTKDHKAYKHTFHENKTLRLKCTFQTQCSPHVLKMMNEFGQGSQMSIEADYDNMNVASVSYNFSINSKSKYIYCIAMDTAGRTLLSSVDLEFVAPPSGSGCRSDEHLQPGTLVVIKDDLPPLLWTVGLVFQVYPAADNSSISVARVLTGRGGGVPVIKTFTDLCPLNN